MWRRQGEYKGFGLSLMIELFSQFLFKNNNTTDNKIFLCSGMIFAFKPTNINLEDANNFIHSLNDKYPGEDSFTNFKINEEKGKIKIDDNILDIINNLW